MTIHFCMFYVFFNVFGSYEFLYVNINNIIVIRNFKVYENVTINIYYVLHILKRLVL